MAVVVMSGTLDDACRVYDGFQLSGAVRAAQYVAADILPAAAAL